MDYGYVRTWHVPQNKTKQNKEKKNPEKIASRCEAIINMKTNI